MELDLRYGMNPHQKKARLYSTEKLPIKILNGEASYINFLDALNAFQLVRELRRSIGQPSAASFKHVSPAGAAVYSPLSDSLVKSYFVEGLELSPLAIAYARARGADRMSSFGDCAAFSDRVDVTIANLLKKEVSDIIVAPGYDEDALAVLKMKKNGKYLILEIDPEFIPDPIERRSVFGITMEQERNDVEISDEIFKNIVTTQRIIPDNSKRDLLVALITLKYTQSNSVCFAFDGQTIGIGAGQQSRIHCTRLAAGKADNWWLRQHPIVQQMNFRAGISRTEINNAIDGWTNEDFTPAEEKQWRQYYFNVVPERLTKAEKQQWLTCLKEVSYASDAFLPFRDNIDRAAQSGVRYLVQTGNSLRDEQVIEAVNQYGMVMAYSGIRLFHH
ncbi:phosphoribosylaminoimidazolecarboxamide formyltransferase [Paenibacillus sp. Soil787]|uniref:phosphoribosylaminoimidazolecarboxamide formyltransferase n=1 Tax=Paenibacillus sp. Soil787 TaxID=1736411 RepID=UPI0007027A6B|nr:phosphoribosylaminoimidazolecarboxamide formyltransferase [Paenibacillus sp. Soil787]KRF21765.1 5-aminoimidazole-4-carboxamide ribonucleotide transformylase [Paenibacillus sp. Soil787]